jgi:hypothetical protein
VGSAEKYGKSCCRNPDRSWGQWDCVNTGRTESSCSVFLTEADCERNQVTISNDCGGPWDFPDITCIGCSWNGTDPPNNDPSVHCTDSNPTCTGYCGSGQECKASTSDPGSCQCRSTSGGGGCKSGYLFECRSSCTGVDIPFTALGEVDADRVIYSLMLRSLAQNNVRDARSMLIDLARL